MPGARSALVLATHAYDDRGLARLRAPEHDAEALASVLGDPQIGGFDVDVVANASAHEVRLAVARFFKDRRPDDLLLLHFSCHGVKDDSGELYFAARDTQLELLEATGVSSSFVNQTMGRSRAGSIVLLLDCCYAGAFARGMVARATASVDIRDRLGGRGRVVVTASSALQYAFEGASLKDGGDSDPGPSVFTSALVQGLRTGDADRDLDGIVTIDELYAYVHDEVTRANPDQTPKRWTFDLSGDLHIAWRPGPVPTSPPPAVNDRPAAPGALDPHLPVGAAAAPSTSVARRQPPWLVAAAAVVVGASVLGLGVWASRGASGGGDATLSVAEALLTTADDGSARIVAVDLGTGATRLVLDDPRAAWPSLSNDRGWLTYLRDGAAGYGVPHDVRVDGSDDAAMLPPSAAADCPYSGRPASSHDGGWQALVCVDESGRPIGLFRFDGEQLVELVSSDHVVVGDVTWTGGQEVVFALADEGDPTTLWQVDADGSSDAEQLTTGLDGWDSSPSWSDEGLLFVRSSGPDADDADVWLLSSDRRLTRMTSRGGVSSATWAPGGEVFAYLATDRDGATTLWRQRMREDPSAVLSGDLGPPSWGGP